MKKQIVAAVCGLSLVLGFRRMQEKRGKAACSAGRYAGAAATDPSGASWRSGDHAQGQTVVNMPDSVKGKWKAATLVVEDKNTKKKNEYTVNLNSDFTVPGSNLKISVGEFLPDFKMEGLNITSLSNDPNNPAVNVKIFEADKEVFKGWLYSKFPAIHPFEHAKYSITLKEGVKKG